MVRRIRYGLLSRASLGRRCLLSRIEGVAYRVESGWLVEGNWNL